MASLNLLLHPSTSLSHPLLPFSSSCSCFFPRTNSINVLTPKGKHIKPSSLIVKAAAEADISISGSIPIPSNPFDSTSPLKFNLLSAVSGLNRGLAASEEDLQKADAAAKELEDAGGLVDLTDNLDRLQGRWKLIYSSAFSSRTLGGSRPGPPIGRLLPITLGQVFQRIDILSKDFDNIVDLQLGAPWPLPPLEVTATLAHKFELVGSSKIKIIFEKTTVKTTGTFSQLPPLDLPQIPDALRPQSNRGSGDFEVTYLDADTRVTRGDRGELRVFVIA
ncbi:putative plastid lipid-associated protein/fibrillin [Medicago truncatula]|uniref:Plastid fibrillin n=1 Tax=Medicago truncatula TaxID=3880 RepID=G7I4U4_MEDTR|nr:plastid-lipid-associated protein 6, chloroplastic [Medicago truncatula]AES61080.1 plastid fibrillin [Medicago truncatula]RHN80360.1 putative plastid lipid-associated protein/fibrillin [Medicago truncatula]